MLFILPLEIVLFGCAVLMWMAGVERWVQPLLLLSTAVTLLHGCLYLL